MSLIMAAIKRPHHAPRSTLLHAPASSIAGNNINIGIGIGISISISVSITAALHGASRLRNSTPLSKTHHSNAARRWGLLCAHSRYRYPKQVPGQFSASVSVSLSLSVSLSATVCICFDCCPLCLGNQARLKTHQQFIKTHQYSSKCLSLRTSTSTLTLTPTPTPTPSPNTKPEMKCLRLI